MEAIRIHAKKEHSEVLPIMREDVQNALKEPRITMPYYTKYEWVTVMGMRVQQLKEGAKPLISLDGLVTSSPQFEYRVAEQEIVEQKLPFIIQRQVNNTSEYWSCSELSVIW